MQLNSFTKQISTAGRWMAKALMGFLAVALLWQGAFLANLSAVAAPTNTLIAADLGTEAQSKVGKDTGRAKNFIQDTKETVEKAARDNASKVDDATGDDSNFIERRARRDASRIHERAEEDANRTEKAVDNTRNAVEGAIDSIKDAFSN
ncbi:hypothetical protein [Pseudanabaena sp. FACHB-2040]|uniref:hypothetical protein n=1 Tax=Pseudanabaena sp. FACHB-2040 TaxID=2692859 RepID=UPI0016834B40|nr:hypothetical protein [Pseudanabaena sp. FACHB-2040]